MTLVLSSGTLLMPSYIDGIEALCYEHLVKAGWITGKAPTLPFPKEQLKLHDPDGNITDAEANTVLERGFNTVKGLTMWAARCVFSRVQVRKQPAVKGGVQAIRDGMGPQCHDAHGCLDDRAQAPWRTFQCR